MTTDHAPAEPTDCNDCSEKPHLPEHVRLSTGEFVWRQEDLRIAGRGLDFFWTRTYRSRPESGDPGWDHAYNLRAQAVEGGIEVSDGAGGTHLFRRAASGASGTYAAKGMFAVAELSSANEFRIRFSGGGSWEFRSFDDRPAAGLVARIVDRNGNAVRFAYDEAGRLDVVTDTLGREMRLGYDSAGRLSTLTDPTGRRVSYRYGADGQLASVTYPPTEDAAKGATVRYTYTGGKLTGITDRAGTPLLDIEYATAFDHERVSSLRWGRIGNPTHYSYQRAEDVSGATLLAIVNDGNGNVRDLLFDKVDACVGVRVYTARADATRPTTRTDNRPAKPVRDGEPEFHETKYTYGNVDGLLTRIVRPDGSVATNSYEGDSDPDADPIARGNLRSITYTPGPAGGAQPELVRGFTYLDGFGCTCGAAFVTRETDARGAVGETRYDERGNPVAITDRTGATTELRYDAFGDLTSRVYPPDAAGVRRRDTFTYSTTTGQCTAETLDADGAKLTTTFRHDKLGRLVLLRDPAGNEHAHEWNASDLLTRRVVPAATPKAEPTIEDSRYDANGRVVTRVVRETGREVTDTTTYDAVGRVLTRSRQVGGKPALVTAYTYDDNGNRVATRHGAAAPVRLSYDTFDRPLRRSRGVPGKGHREVTYDYDAGGRQVRVTRGTGAERSSVVQRHDGYGRLVEMSTPDGVVAEFTHDGNGNVLRQVRRGRSVAAAEVTQQYDAENRLIRRTTTGPGIAEPLVETWEFDARSRLVSRTDATGRVMRGTFDALDRPQSIDDGAGRVTVYAHDANSNVIEEVTTHEGTGLVERTGYVRDARGRTVEVTGPRGMAQTYDYDLFDRPGVIGLSGRARLAIDYDGAGRPVTARLSGTDKSDKSDKSDVISMGHTWSDASRITARTDPNGNVTRFDHDAAGEMVAIEHPDGSRISYRYDSRGNCVGWTDANGSTVVNTFDAMDRLLRRDVEPGKGVAADTTTERYDYDELGRMVRARNDGHTVTWRHDGLSRVVAEAQDGHEVTSTYGAGGLRTSVGYPSGYRLDLGYEGAELRRIGDAKGVAVRLDERGTIAFTRTPVTSTVNWTAAGLPETLRTVATSEAGSTVLADRRYRWDAAGNVVGVDVRDATGTRSVSHTLDPFGRLRRSSTSDGRRVEYDLDPAGNRTALRVNGKEGRHTMGDPRDKATNRYTVTPTDRRAYDANGNLVSITDGRGQRRTMRYDYLNRMVEFRDEATGTTTSYGYDCFGRRLTKVTAAGEVRYVWDGEHLVEERAGSTTRSLVRHGRAVYGMATAAGDRWFVTDVLGSVRAEFDDAGAVVRSYDYDDFGLLTVGTGKGDPPPVTFGGYTHDAESGLYYARTRYLEPHTGRFTTMDTAGTWEDGRNRGNAYAFVGNNPATFVDPTGQSTNRSYSCNGPWPGPRTVWVEYEGCSRARRDQLATPVCRAFRAAGQSQERVLSLWINDMSGQPQAGAEVTRGRVAKWFGGPDNATSQNSKAEIGNTLHDVYDALRSNDVDIDCEGGPGNCVGVIAYVNWGGWDVNVNDSFFNCYNRSQMASILIHELTHAYNDTDDYGYYPVEDVNQPWNQIFETPTLRENADSYRMFALEFYLP